MAVAGTHGWCRETFGFILRIHYAAKHRHRLAALRMRRFAGDSESVSPLAGPSIHQRWTGLMRSGGAFGYTRGVESLFATESLAR